MRQLIEDDREWCPFSVGYIFFGRGSRFILRQHKEDIIAFGNWTANLLSAFFDTSSRFSPGEVGFFSLKKKEVIMVIGICTLNAESEVN